MPADFLAIVEGGEHFVARLTALQRAKQEAEAALAELTRGKSIEDARREVEQLRVAAQAEADRIIADAKAEAKRISAKALRYLDAFAKLDTPAA